MARLGEGAFQVYGPILHIYNEWFDNNNEMELFTREKIKAMSALTPLQDGDGSEGRGGAVTVNFSSSSGAIMIGVVVSTAVVEGTTVAQAAN